MASERRLGSSYGRRKHQEWVKQQVHFASLDLRLNCHSANRYRNRLGMDIEPLKSYLFHGTGSFPLVAPRCSYSTHNNPRIAHRDRFTPSCTAVDKGGQRLIPDTYVYTYCLVMTNFHGELMPLFAGASAGAHAGQGARLGPTELRSAWTGRKAVAAHKAPSGGIHQ